MAGRFGSVNYGGSKRTTPLLGASGKLERTKISDSSPKTVLGGMNQVLRAYFSKREKEEAKEKDAADRAAAMEMFKDYTKPQAEWDVEKYGSTPKTLRDAGFNVSMSDALGDQSLEGDEPADQNWMTGKESQEFYDEQAAKEQRDFDAENRYGIDALEDSYAPATGELSMIDKLMGKKKGTSEGPETVDMRYALMKDAVSEEGKRKARLLAEQDARVKNTRGIEAEARKANRVIDAAFLKNQQEVAAAKAKRENPTPEKTTAKIAQANALFVARRALKSAKTEEERETAQAVVDSLEFTIRGQDPDSVGKREAAKMAPRLTQLGKAAWATFDSKSAPLLAMSANVDKILYGDGTEKGKAKAKSGLEYRTGYSSFIPAAAQFSEDARATQAQLMTLGSKIKQSVLQAYRDMGQTGGAVGQVSNQEQEMFLNNLAAMEQSQSYEDFVENMKIIKFFVEGNPNGTEFEKKGTIARIRESMELEHGLKSRYLPATEKPNIEELLKQYGN